METIDIVLLVFLAVGAYRGFSTGLLMQLLGIVSFFLAVIGGLHLMDFGVEFLSQNLEGYEALLPFIAFLFIFILIIVTIHIVGKTLKSLLDMTLLGGFDNIAGAVAGLFKWALVISVLIWFASSFELLPTDEYYDNTTIFPIVASVAPILLETISGLLPHLQDIIITEPDLPQA